MPCLYVKGAGIRLTTASAFVHIAANLQVASAAWAQAQLQAAENGSFAPTNLFVSNAEGFLIKDANRWQAGLAAAEPSKTKDQ